MGEANFYYFTCLKLVNILRKYKIPVSGVKFKKTFKNGERSQNSSHFLCRGQVQKAHGPQSDAIQEGQGLSAGSRQTSLRPQAKGIRRSDQAHLQKEGQDHQKDRPQIGVHRCKLQEKASNDHQEMQAFRAGRREEEEGTNAPILRSDLSEEEKLKVVLKQNFSFVFITSVLGVRDRRVAFQRYLLSS